MHRNYCQKCGKGFDAEYILNSGSGIPLCDACGGKIKPDVVLYEEGLDRQTLEDAVFYISQADVLIVGTLDRVLAAGLIDYYRGDKLVLINKSTTPMDGRANLLMQGGAWRGVRADKLMAMLLVITIDAANSWIK